MTSRQYSLFPTDESVPEKWEVAADADLLAAEVALNVPVETTFHYLVPEELRSVVGPGQRVKVPFGRGNRRMDGVCVSLGPPPEIRHKLKHVDAVIDREPLLSGTMLRLTKWIGEYYLCGWGQVLQAVVPSGVKRQAGTRLITSYRPADHAADALADQKLPAKQKAVLTALCEAEQPMQIEELCEIADCGVGPVTALRKKGLAVAIRERADTFEPIKSNAPQIADLILNPDQQSALDAILKVVRGSEHQTILLHGATGSGKTEVYIRAIREVVEYGRQAIVLVPEISLTPQTIRRFQSRFDSVAVLHSHLTDAERHWQWQQIARGGVQVVVGARSAVFAPTPHLGLVVIDEEHETSFKQDSVPRYHATEVARERCRLENVPLVLGSATPTLESWRRVHDGRDQLISMPNRVNGLPLPPVVIVDVRNDPRIRKGASIGRALEQAIRTAIADDGQVILFLNLRGYSPVFWCRACGESVKCPDCDVSLTWHRDRGVALCHTCDYESPPPEQCPSCNEPNPRVLGSGTQRLEAEVKTRFSDVECLRMDSDSMKKPGSHDEALEKFRRGEVQLLLGTQMIAKGLDFPNVTLVGVITADTLLHQPDMRASERTFQLIAQVAGRTGRSERGGRVFVQTSSPAESAIQCAAQHDFLTFAEAELITRKEFEAPPFRHLLRVIIRGPIEADVKAYAKELANALKQAGGEAEGDSVSLLGPAPAPVARMKKYFRYHIQLTAEAPEALRRVWQAGHETVTPPAQVEVAPDMDALNLR